MFPKLLSTIAAFAVVTFHAGINHAPAAKVLAQKDYSLADRYTNTFVNNVFADNILLTLSYMAKQTKDGQSVNWNQVKAPFTYKIILLPGQTFAFHDKVLPQYQGKITATTNAHFDSNEGFESDGWLVADGVCHLASFMNVVARQAGLTVDSPTPHDFAKIADVPKQYGVAIYYMPGEQTSSSLQNLYVTNPFDKPIAFVFNHQGENLNVSVEEMN